MKLFLPFVVLLIASLASAEGVESEGEECPAGCECDEERTGPFLAKCTTLNPTQRFGFKTSRLIIQGDPNLVIEKDTFTTVGLKDVSTIVITNCTFKKLDPDAFRNLKELQTLHFELNNQLVLDQDMFNSTELIQLVLRHNKVKFPQDFKYLFDIPDIRELEISGAELTQLPEAAFSKMPHLQRISLSSNKIKNVGKEFSILPELEEVDLSNNMIGEIAPGVFEKNEDLTSLLLDNNPLTTLKGVSLPSLLELYVGFCKFSKIDKDTFAGLSGMRILNLSGNAVSELAEDSFVNNTQLTHIDLSRNALQTLPENLFQPLDGLQILCLSHNVKLQNLPNGLFKNQRNLFLLDLSSCGLQEIDENLFRDLDTLSILRLGGNLIQRLKAGVLKSSIVRLDLSNNNINLIDEIEFPQHSRIRNLNLAGNKLYDIFTSQLMELSGLEGLDLSSCTLKSFWDTTNKAPKLKSLLRLSIAHNSIQTITPEQLALTPNLEFFDITDNKIVCNETFNSAVKWLNKNNVKPYPHRSRSMPMKMDRDSETVSSVPVGWFEIQLSLCGTSHAEEIAPINDKPGEDIDEDYAGEGEDDEGEEEDEDDDENAQYNENTLDDMDSIVQRKILTGESEDNYMWPVLIVSISAIAILFSLTILAAFVLRWSRQRNSYGAQMIRHLNHPTRRDGSSYQQLYEDPNHPTTPVMSMRHANQIRYNFPDTSGKNVGYITYLSKDYHDSTVEPQPV